MLKLRDARKEDSEIIVKCIRELAEFEKLTHECFVKSELIAKWLFGEKPRAHCLIAEWEGRPAGIAIYFYSFSSFAGKPGIYIEDLFIRSDFRRKGIASEILKHIAKKAVDEDCARLEWSVLNWNSDAIKFYASLGAESLDEWAMQRVSGKALDKLAR